MAARAPCAGVPSHLLDRDNQVFLPRIEAVGAHLTRDGQFRARLDDVAHTRLQRCYAKMGGWVDGWMAACLGTRLFQHRGRYVGTHLEDDFVSPLGGDVVGGDRPRNFALVSEPFWEEGCVGGKGKR